MSDQASSDEIMALAQPLQAVSDLDPLINRVGNARCVLIGEASHGTSEYYTWRAELTKRLITERGFSFVAVEGDWPDCFEINRWVKGRDGMEKSALDIVSKFDRWPTWMWANSEVAEFVEWLRRHNEAGGDVGFYGLDVYSLWDSMSVVLQYLREHEPQSLEAAEAAFHCFQPYAEDPQAYAWNTRMVPDGCRDEVVRLLSEVRHNLRTIDGDPEASFDAVQNAAVVAQAEHYYRSMMGADEQSWNVRDTHMADTLDRLMAHHDARHAKAVVWAHNTHIGDARATDMARAGMINLGQLVRERYGNHAVVLVGCSGYEGSVIAAQEWGEPMEVMPVPASRSGTHEHLLHEALGSTSLLVFPDDRSGPWLGKSRGHRAIGVVYNPAHERYGNYVPTVMGGRYDALMSFDSTEALHPLHVRVDERKEYETFPTAE